MRLASFRYGDRKTFGAIGAAGVVDLGARCDDGLRTLGDVLRAERLPALLELAAGADADCGLDEISFLPTITDPGKIVCIGVNYVNRNEEYKDGAEPPRYPSVFLRTRESLVGHEQPLVRPPESSQLDYEGEIAIVIGKPGRRIAAGAAHAHIAGLSLLNEGSIRDWLRHSKFNVTQGKNFARSGAFGPWMVTADEIAGYDKLWLTTRVNGEVRQHDTTANLLFPFDYLIHYLSTFMPLAPGDVISTGTPNGAGARFDPPRYLQPGDVVEIEVPGVGLLRNSVIDEEDT